MSLDPVTPDTGAPDSEAPAPEGCAELEREAELGPPDLESELLGEQVAQSWLSLSESGLSEGEVPDPEWDMWAALEEEEPPWWFYSRRSWTVEPGVARHYAAAVVTLDGYAAAPPEVQAYIAEHVAIDTLVEPHRLEPFKACLWWGDARGSLAEGSIEKACATVVEAGGVRAVDADPRLEARWCEDSWVCGGSGLELRLRHDALEDLEVRAGQGRARFGVVSFLPELEVEKRFAYVYSSAFLLAQLREGDTPCWQYPHTRWSLDDTDFAGGFQADEDHDGWYWERGHFVRHRRGWGQYWAP